MYTVRNLIVNLFVKVCVCVYLLCRGGRLQQTLLFPQAAGPMRAISMGFSRYLLCRCCLMRRRLCWYRTLFSCRKRLYCWSISPSRLWNTSVAWGLFVGRIRPVTDTSKQAHVMGNEQLPPFHTCIWQSDGSLSATKPKLLSKTSAFV